MKTEIYYFSGTGNSLIVARDLAHALEADLIPIASLQDKTSINSSAGAIGIVTPNYYGDLPPIIKRFAEKLSNIEDKYIFGLCTYGGGPGRVLITLDRIIRSRGGRLHARFGISMVQNAFYKAWEKYDRYYVKWRKKLSKIASIIKSKKAILIPKDLILNIPFYGFNHLAIKLAKNYLRKLTGSSRNVSLDEMMHQADAGYRVTEDCNSCGLCVKVCPVNNISLKDGEPEWHRHCENCLACYNFCPQKAIIGEIGKQGYYYRNPDITASDIIKQSAAQRS